MQPTTEILERISKDSLTHKEEIFTIRHTSVCTRTRVHRQKVSIKTQQTVSAKLRLKKSFSPWQMKPISPRQYDELILQRKAIRRRSVH